MTVLTVYALLGAVVLLVGVIAAALRLSGIISDGERDE